MSDHYRGTKLELFDQGGDVRGVATGAVVIERPVGRASMTPLVDDYRLPTAPIQEMGHDRPPGMAVTRQPVEEHDGRMLGVAVAVDGRRLAGGKFEKHGRRP